ncbi:ATP-binding cassette domain-containing protein [Nocardia sp. NPDC050413]|uniref:ATP-binding cassette domain-containing protein n=1 Tax=Nocardia sp. NPDC050413 TaxID=3155784 RepID=UPI0034077066
MSRVVVSPREGLRIDGLTVRIPVRRGAVVHAVSEVSLEVAAGTVTALVGESGCGKSVVASAVMGVLPQAAVVSGAVHLGLSGRSVQILGDRVDSSLPASAGTDLGASQLDHPQPIPGVAEQSGERRGSATRWLARLRSQVEPYRGRHIALVPQSASTHFTPVRTLGSQLAETVAVLGTSQTPADLLRRAGLEPTALDLYPHQLSGGMAQRAAVAAALAGDPAVIIADEPTAGLDRDHTDRIGALLRECADAGAAVLLITHDLSHLLRAGIADTVAIMYASRLMEVGPAAEVFADPWHDYTRDLLAALPENGLHPLPHPPRELTNLSDICPYAGGPTALVRQRRRMIRKGVDGAHR